MPKNNATTTIDLRACIHPIILLFLVTSGIYAGLRYWHSIAVPNYSHSPSINPWELRLTRLTGAFEGDKPVVWAFSYYKSTEWTRRRNRYQLDIINPQNQTLIKRHFFENKMYSTLHGEFNEFELIGNQMFIASPVLGLQWRNMGNGDIEKTEKELIQKFPRLAAGIGEIGGDYGEMKWRVLTTKDGLELHYSPILDKLYDNEEKLKLEETFDKSENLKASNGKTFYKWGLSGEGNRKELILIKEYKSIFATVSAENLKFFDEAIKRANENALREAEYWKRQEEYLNKLSPEQMANKINQLKKEQAQRKSIFNEKQAKGQKLIFHLKNRFFLNANIIYQDSTQCLVLHTNEISAEALPVLSYIKADGKISWQWNASSLKILQNRYKSRLHHNDLSAVVGKNNQMMIFSNFSGEAGVVGIDLNTGKVLWEWMAL